MSKTAPVNEPSGEQSSHPLIMYKDIANYMCTKRKAVSADPNIANRLSAEEGAELINHVHGGEINVDVRLINSSYTAV